MKLTLRALVALLLLTLGASPTFAANGTLAPLAYQTVLDANGNPISGAKICTYLAGTTTAAMTWTEVTLTTPNSNPILADSSGRFVAFLQTGASYKFVFQDATGTANTCDGAPIKTVDNISAVPGSSSSLDIVATAGEALTAGQAVYLSAGDGGKSAGQWYKADPANGYSSATAVSVGMVPASIAGAASGTVRLAGSLPGLTSLTIGSAYYVSTAGAITSTAPAVGVRRALGVADTTTSLVLSADPPPALVPTPALTVTTDFATAARFTATAVGSGTATFDVTGVQLSTGVTITSSEALTWQQASGGNANLRAGSPTFGVRLTLITKGTDAQVSAGIGLLTVTGTAITFTGQHVGFKLTWASSGVASLFASQADGTTEAVSSALTTVVAGDELDLLLRVNGSTNVEYYWRKNGGALSSATILATNLPTNAPGHAQFAISNTAVASSSIVSWQGAMVIR